MTCSLGNPISIIPVTAFSKSGPTRRFSSADLGGTCSLGFGSGTADGTGCAALGAGFGTSADAAGFGGTSCLTSVGLGAGAASLGGAFYKICSHLHTLVTISTKKSLSLTPYSTNFFPSSVITFP